MAVPQDRNTSVKVVEKLSKSLYWEIETRRYQLFNGSVGVITKRLQVKDYKQEEEEEEDEDDDDDDDEDLQVAHPQSGSSSTLFLLELEFGNVGF